MERAGTSYLAAKEPGLKLVVDAGFSCPHGRCMFCDNAAFDNVEIGHVDFLKDAAFIKVFYTLGHDETGSIDQLTRAKDYVEQ